MDNKFKTVIKMLRQEKNLTQNQLGEVLNCSKMAISHWENSGKEPGFNMLIKIAKYFDVSTDYLLGLED